MGKDKAPKSGPRGGGGTLAAALQHRADETPPAVLSAPPPLPSTTATGDTPKEVRVPSPPPLPVAKLSEPAEPESKAVKPSRPGSPAELSQPLPGPAQVATPVTGPSGTMMLPAPGAPDLGPSADNNREGLSVGPDDTLADGDEQPSRRAARRRGAGPSRARIAANDDAPSIGGLIYALNQKPSGRPYYYATLASAIWVALCLGFGTVQATGGFATQLSFKAILISPLLLPFAATLLGPIALAFLLALLAWRTEELHLRSMAMTEVAVRLAEPDRMAEQQVASLGQSVRRQVSFMNDAVERALGRAGELEAMVHNEVSSLERSYEDNERRIRSLLSELANERHALSSTGDQFQSTLRTLGSEVPGLIENLTAQQIKLSQLVDSAGQNLTQLESALGQQTGRLESTMSDGAQQLQSFFEGYTQALALALGARADEIRGLLSQSVSALDSTLGDKGEAIQAVLAAYTEALGGALDHRTGQMQTLLTDQRERLDSQGEAFVGQLADRTEMIQTVFEEYGLALDTTLANRAEELDTRILERTRALEVAFSDRLEAFDEAVLRSTMAIDGTVAENSRLLTGALEAHAGNLSQTMREQSAQIDETLMQGVSAVRRTSENISRQSLKAIEGLASQADMLKSVSENLLTQIHGVTNRFENQGQAIMRSANALETANYKIDQTLQRRASDLNETLQTLSGRADELGKLVQDYSVTLDGSLSEAEGRARQITQDLQRGTEERSQATLAELSRFQQRLEGTMTEAETRTRLITQDLSRTTEERSQATLADLGRFQQTLEGSLNSAQEKARSMSEELARDTEQRSKATLAELARMKQEARREADRTLELLRAEFSNVSREISERLGAMGSDFTNASGELRAQAGRAAAELQQDQARLRDQLERLPGATRESAEAMRRALQDQLRALDQLTQLSRRAAAERDVSQPAHPRSGGLPAGQPPRALVESAVPPGERTGRGERPNPDDRSRALSSLTSTLQREMTQRQSGRPLPQQASLRDAPTGTPAYPGHDGQATSVAYQQPARPPAAAMPPQRHDPSPAAPSQQMARPVVRPAPAAQMAAPQSNPHPVGGQPVPASERDGWRLGELLQRASLDEAPVAAAVVPQAASQPVSHHQTGPFDLAAASRAMDPATAAAVWARHRAGQRNFMVRSIYPEQARLLFDTAVERYRGDAGFRQNIAQFMGEFDRMLADCDARDPSGGLALEQVTTDTGRVYLFLAHACGQLG